MFFDMVVRHSALLGKRALNVEGFYVKTIGWGLKSGLFPCYRVQINDFLSSYNQNLKIDIFTPLQQIPCYGKSRLGTLRLISWWRVTFAMRCRQVAIVTTLSFSVYAPSKFDIYSFGFNSSKTTNVMTRNIVCWLLNVPAAC